MSANYNFDNCLIDISKVSGGVKMIDYYPELSAYPEFVNVNNDNEIKIAIAISDIGSPFIKIKEPTMRLKALFEYLGIDLRSKEDQDFFDRVLNYTDDKVFPACSRYIQMINNHDFASWWGLNISFYHLQRESIKPMAVDADPIKYSNNMESLTTRMDKIAEKLKTYEARLFSDTQMKQKIVNEQLKKIEFFPEKFAEKFPGFPTKDEIDE